MRCFTTLTTLGPRLLCITSLKLLDLALSRLELLPQVLNQVAGLKRPLFRSVNLFGWLAIQVLDDDEQLPRGHRSLAHAPAPYVVGGALVRVQLPACVPLRPRDIHVTIRARRASLHVPVRQRVITINGTPLLAKTVTRNQDVTLCHCSTVVCPNVPHPAIADMDPSTFTLQIPGNINVANFWQIPGQHGLVRKLIVSLHIFPSVTSLHHLFLNLTLEGLEELQLPYRSQT
mmetsp:Transcript_51368/g.137099  ORF Transcript_51368/g.137099 Transcript_51368/m.137099 type:complete len:231 (-) Transcript_51368:66-758(-)